MLTLQGWSIRMLRKQLSAANRASLRGQIHQLLWELHRFGISIKRLHKRLQIKHADGEKST